MMENLYAAFVAIVVSVVCVLAILATRAFLKSEYWAKNSAKFMVFRPFVEAAIIQVANAVNSGADMSYYEAKAREWAKPVSEGGHDVDLDPRMWAVLDKIDQNPMFNGYLEFDTVVTLVEGWYQSLRMADNGLVLNPEKDIVNAESGKSAQGTIEVVIEEPVNFSEFNK